MTIELRFSSVRIQDDRIQKLARDFARQANSAGDIAASLPEAAGGATDRGDPVTIGAVVLAILGSGAVAEVIKLIRSYLERDDSLSLEVVFKDGRKVSVSGKNLDTTRIEALTEAVKRSMDT